MKYIVMRVCYGSPESGVHQLVPVIFPNQLVHQDVFNKIKELYEPDGPVEIVSAGDIRLEAVECCGDSETLDVESRDEEDDTLIGSFDYFHGIE